MSEIGKSEIGKINTSYNTQQLGKKNDPIEEKAENNRDEITELTGAKALGGINQAMLKTDNIDKDMEILLKNPQKVDDAEKLYDIAMSIMPENLSDEDKANYAAAATVVATEG